MEKYDFMSTQDLFLLLQNNMRTLKTIVDMMVGETPYPDPRDVANMVLDTTMDDYLHMISAAKIEFTNNLDLLEILTSIAAENVEIHKSLSKRV